MASSQPGRTHKVQKRKLRSERILENLKLENLKTIVRDKIQQPGPSVAPAA